MSPSSGSSLHSYSLAFDSLFAAPPHRFHAFVLFIYSLSSHLLWKRKTRQLKPCLPHPKNPTPSPTPLMKNLPCLYGQFFSAFTAVQNSCTFLLPRGAPPFPLISPGSINTYPSLRPSHRSKSFFRVLLGPLLSHLMSLSMQLPIDGNSASHYYVPSFLYTQPIHALCNLY